MEASEHRSAHLTVRKDSMHDPQPTGDRGHSPPAASLRNGNASKRRRKPLIIGGIVAAVVGLGAIGSAAEDADTDRTSIDAERSEAIESIESPSTETRTTDAPRTTPTEPVATTTIASTFTVAEVIDGDTLDLSDGSRVRLIGIDAQESGSGVCASAATNRLRALVAGRAVTVAPGARDDVDRYGRLLRYVDVGGTDVGLTLINEGLAIARYDRRDGYGTHTHEAAYVAADAASPDCSEAPPARPAPPPPPAPPSAPAPVPAPPRAPAPAPSWSYANCTEARAAGAAPVYRGEPGYGAHLDRDGDGVGCE
jgi:endonuclease YncB( thermonuclease family)